MGTVEPSDADAPIRAKTIFFEFGNLCLIINGGKFEGSIDIPKKMQPITTHQLVFIRNPKVTQQSIANIIPNDTVIKGPNLSNESPAIGEKIKFVDLIIGRSFDTYRRCFPHLPVGKGGPFLFSVGQ